MRRYKLSGLCLLWLLSASPAHSDDTSIGYVKTSTPNAFLVTDGKTEPAVVGSAIHVGCIIKTDANGTLGLTLKDNTVLSFGADTEFEITQFLYQPTDAQLKLDMTLLKGTLHYISGVIAKLKPTAVQLNTPAGIIGARGTHFVVKVED
ncbi:MAG: FecR domain-containing protein [Methylococcaceae bacterium]